MKDMHILQSKNAQILNFGFDNGLLLGTYVQEAHKSNDDDGVHARVCVSVARTQSQDAQKLHFTKMIFFVLGAAQKCTR